MINPVIRFLSFSVLFIGLIMARPAHAEVMIADEVRTFPAVLHFDLVGGEWGNAKLFEASSVPVSLSTHVSFHEEKGYYGFSALICDEKNAALYLESQPAACARYEINSSKDDITFETDGSSSYYILILNRTEPLAIQRNITVNSTTAIKWPQDVKDLAKSQIETSLQTIERRHGITPYNVALVPCQDVYIPSSEGLLTLCSELALTPQMEMDPNLALAYLFYEAAPFYETALKMEPIVKNETKRFEYALAMMLTLTNDDQALQRIYDWHVQNQTNFSELQKTIRRTNRKFSIDANMAAIQDFFSDSTKELDTWLETIYATMNNETLTNIQDMKETHFKASRNIARMVLNDRSNNKEFEKNEENKAPAASGRQKLLDLTDEIF